MKEDEKKKEQKNSECEQEKDNFEGVEKIDEEGIAEGENEMNIDTVVASILPRSGGNQSLNSTSVELSPVPIEEQASVVTESRGANKEKALGKTKSDTRKECYQDTKDADFDNDFEDVEIEILWEELAN